MNRRKHVSVISLALAMLLLVTMLGGCGKPDAAEEPALPAQTAEAEVPAEPTEAPAAEAETGRRDGERFEAVIILEGMEETVHYEHLRNDSLGFEMDYDYENFLRHSEGDREIFVSCWDDPDQPENYLEVKYSPLDAETLAENIGAVLSNTYEISRDDAFMLEGAGRCIRIDASAEPGGLTMPDQLQMVYIIPAPDGCRIATAHYAIEGSEGFGRRFRYMMDSFSAFAGQGEKRLTDEQALAAIRNYCWILNPDLEGIMKAGEYPVYWEISSSDEKEIVVLFRSYTGAVNRYHIDPVSGDAYVTELVQGTADQEQRTEESLNVWAYWF